TSGWRANWARGQPSPWRCRSPGRKPPAAGRQEGRRMGDVPKRVLAVDDDIDILDAIRLTLEDEGYLVTTTEKGEYAENLKDGNGGLPDLIILDLLLSGKDGRTICRSLKSRPDTQRI